MVPDGWKLTGLDGIRASIIDGDRGKNYPKKDDYLSDGYALFLGAENIVDGAFDLNKKIFISKEKHEAMRKGIVQDKDIILVMRGNGTGRSCIFFSDKLKGKVARINSGLIIIRPSLECADVNFLHQLFLSDLIKKQFDSVIFGSAQPQLTVKLLKSLTFPVPPYSEQVKIAHILSVWDKIILLTEQLLKNSQQQKKILMQKLLTGKKRFLGFESPWENKMLSEVMHFTKGVQINKNTLSESGGYPVINGGITPSGFTADFNTFGNTITISEGGNSCGHVAFQRNDFWCGGHCYAIKETKLDLDFTYQMLKLNEKKIMNLRVGSGLPNIQKKSLESFVVRYPVDKFEQQKIASTLSSADAEIDILQKKIACLKDEKKGLMQQLLTGKRRVKMEIE
ncbi:restriction endonuclease subunit S [Citrobacter freundii]|nr:restriction endonuclease subunit S [Citrobacter freundii]